MRKVWVIVIGYGEYSNRTETPWRVYLDERSATELMAKLEAIAAPLEEMWNGPPFEHPSWNGTPTWTERMTAARAAYLALGIDELDGDGQCFVDWALHEVDLYD